MTARVEALRMRLQAVDVPRADVALAGAAAVAFTLEHALWWSSGPGPHALAVAGGLTLAACLAVRRRAPLAAIAAAQPALFLLELGAAGSAEDVALPYLALLFLNYSAAAHLDAPRWRAAPAVAFAGVFATLLIPDARNTLDLGGLVWVLFLYLGGPFLVGRVVHGRTKLNLALHEKAERLDRDKAGRAEWAVAEERARLAAELHDIVAEALAEMVAEAEAEAAERHADDDAEAARRALAAVEGTGREALGELRRALGVLVVADQGGQAAGDLGGSGHGLVGMAERLRAYGGELNAGPGAAGGFTVRARLPVRQDEMVAA
jgi:signal transduction histidine kinase